MKKIFTTIAIMCSVLATQGQTLHVQNGAEIYTTGSGVIDGALSPAPALFVEGDIVNNGQIQNLSEIQVKGNFENNGSYTSDGDDVFVGSGSQAVSGTTSPTTFNNLVLDKSGTALDQAVDVNVTTQLHLVNGVLRTNSFLCYVANSSPSGVQSTAASGSPTNYVEGKFTQALAPNTYTYYVGDNLHNTQKVTITFRDIATASAMEVEYSSAGSGTTNQSACGGTFDVQSGEWIITPNDITGPFDYDIALSPGGDNAAILAAVAGDAVTKDGVFITNPCANSTGNYGATNITSFSSFRIVGTSSTALGLVLLDFGGKQLPARDLLFWKTKEEKDIASYEVQYSTDGNVFTSIGSAIATGGAGNYELPHLQPKIGHNYYRLLVVDKSGNRYVASNTIDLKRSLDAFNLSVYPNPAYQSFTAAFALDKAANANIRVLDVSGKLVAQQSISAVSGSNEAIIDISHCAAGMYSVELFIANTRQQVVRLVKQ
ncbi:MAG: hypothetical protein RL660_981 [Bacteroidota bacterium]|jgi:hypothetical protein